MSTLSEAPSDESHLSESTYDFVDTDEESRDDNGTESVASMEFGRPDDLASLADTENSDESGDEHTHNSSSIPAYGLDGSISNEFSTPTLGRTSAVLVEEPDRPLSQSIEFEEPHNSLGVENVSVRHTVADFYEEQTEVIARDMQMQNAPQRLILTIRQTMTKQGLSTKEPLRILYVGSHAAKQDIIHKIASSVTASIESSRSQLRSSAQLYNVVPVSAFGSEKTPEIELMHSSGYQIKVDDCISAQGMEYEDTPEKPEVIKLTLDDNYHYHSVPEDDHFFVEPEWELPHVAVIFCSDNDDGQARRTRTLSRKFMSRHGIPSIVISHQQTLNKSQCMTLDHHSVHMCLESRDANGRGNIVHQRLPIDLTSFLNIDARQMNRNLAYLTGLHEPTVMPSPPLSAKRVDGSPVNSQVLEKPYTKTGKQSWISNLTEWRSLLPFGLLALSVLAAVASGGFNYWKMPSPAISVNSKVMSAEPITTPSLKNDPAAASITSVLASVATSTRTVTVTQAPPSGPNNLAVVPPMEVGKVAPTAQKPLKTDSKCGVCKAEILGDKEILIRIPSTTKLSWLTKEAMSVKIMRDNTTVDTERAYSTDDGIVLSLSKKEAHGVLNVSVITTRRPKVNETFQVDFGSNTIQNMQDLLGRFYTFFKEDTVIVDGQTLADVRVAAEKVLKDARESSQTTLAGMEEARRQAIERAASITSQLTESAMAMSFEAAKRSARISHEVGSQIVEAEKVIAKQLQSLQNIREPMDDGILKAQVRSKLLWLKMLGKDAEYDEYKSRAISAARKKLAVAADEKPPQQPEQQQKKTRRALKKSAKKEARAVKKGKAGRAVA
ncbi:glycosyltransferase family 15 protein [Rutstroemia sp. NJR-2017a WRK4]|nr:glycosyltransferase family 15 protein [Rutstroemia sp. NJR-2017a WRK4]